ncbi:MAG: hypothetical protein B6240_10875 [Desulfobacteraceae bacterium 4572_87]|nr:MAG: hypothetical protein B6240_10875 [Desulfobacteraceae bacterium 4572_87]
MMDSKSPDPIEMFDFMSHTRVFAPLPEDELRNLCMHMTREQFSKGFILCKQDETALDKVYVIESGSLELYFDGEEGKRLRRRTLF